MKLKLKKSFRSNWIKNLTRSNFWRAWSQRILDQFQSRTSKWWPRCHKSWNWDSSSQSDSIRKLMTAAGCLSFMLGQVWFLLVKHSLLGCFLPASVYANQWFAWQQVAAVACLSADVATEACCRINLAADWNDRFALEKKIATSSRFVVVTSSSNKPSFFELWAIKLKSW